MKRRTFLHGVTGAVMGTAATASAAGAASRPRPPNVLLVLTDDQGWGDVRSHGNERIDTPVLDRLAADGARFERFYVSPLCAPTRASLLTGRYHLRTGVSGVTRGLETMRSEEVTLAEVLREAGYATGCFGKWHNGSYYPHHPNGQGFEEFVGFCGGHWNNYFDTGLEHNGSPVATKGYITDVLTDATIGFIEKHRDRPFFAYVPYNAPHGPFQVPDRWFDKHKARGVDDRNAAIYGMCENIDDNVGRLLARLEALGLARDTIVVFLTDNGPNGARFNGGMRETKGSAHEGGVRVPCFVRWPGRIAPGTVVRPPAAHIDLLPTLVELCGLPRPRTLPLDGTSLVPLLEGRSAGWPDRLIFTHQARGSAWPPPGAVRSERYRLVLTAKGRELYDMTADPGETRDLAAERPDVVRELAGAYEAWFKDVPRGLIERPPIPVGHAEAPAVTLLAPEAYFSGGVAYKGKQGWANDWLTNWRSPDDAIWWELDVVRAGRFEPTLLYTCPERDVGATVRVEAAGRGVEGTLGRAHDPPPVPSPDRVPRGEVHEKVWAPLALEPLELPAGRVRLLVRALAKPGEAVMDLKAVRLRRVQ